MSNHQELYKFTFNPSYTGVLQKYEVGGRKLERENIQGSHFTLDIGANAQGQQGVLTVIVERMQEQRFPRALELKAKVDAGETLEDFDIDFLEKVFEDCTSLKPLLDRHPQYQELAARMMSLYHAITERALANEPPDAS